MFYLRWSGLLLLVALVAVLGIRRYYSEVIAITPRGLIASAGDDVRVLGVVEGGSLGRNRDAGGTTFQLSGDNERVSVQYVGENTGDIRELKTIVVEGRFDPVTKTFTAYQIAPIPNYDFVAAAYLIAFIPMIVFLFNMERNVVLLYIMIKQEKGYQPEEYR